MTVLADENQPPVPLTHASWAFSTWRPCGLAPQLTGRLDEQEHAAHAGMAMGQAAAVGVGGKRAAEPELAVLDERAAFAGPAEAERLEAREHHVGEGVVDLAGVDVGGLDAGPLEREPAARVRRASG